MRGICAIVGVGMAMVAYDSFRKREWLYFFMFTPWAVILFIAAVFGEES